MKKGGLIKELEEKIRANIEIIHQYEEIKNKLMYYNTTYDYAYNQSYNSNWLKSHNMNNFDIINYRQSLINKICHNNNLLDEYKNKIEKHINISNLFQRIYFFLHFYSNPFNKKLYKN